MEHYYCFTFNNKLFSRDLSLIFLLFEVISVTEGFLELTAISNQLLQDFLNLTIVQTIY